MKISLFYEFPLPRPWGGDDEHQLFQDGLTEVEAADKAGFSTVWLTEHHFLEEYCHQRPRDVPRRGKPAHQGHSAGLRGDAPAAADQPSGAHRRADLDAGPSVQRPGGVRHR